MGKKRHSAGVLLYRQVAGLEVIIVHPSGSYNANAAWSIPKGLIDDEETDIKAGRRELKEETGAIAPDVLIPLGTVQYKNGKKVTCFAGVADPEYKPAPASWEVDKVEYFSADDAEKILHPAQQEFVRRLKKMLK
jgi:predicted NUDIX family NTP pyrophosphohydrolase